MLNYANVRTGAVLFSTVLLVVLIGHAHAESEFDVNIATNVSSRLGINAARTFFEKEDVKVNSSGLPKEEKKKLIEDSIKEFSGLRKAYTGISRANFGMKIGIGASTGIAAATLTAAPLSVPLVPLIGIAVYYSLDIFQKKTGRIGNKQLDEKLDEIKAKVLNTRNDPKYRKEFLVKLLNESDEPELKNLVFPIELADGNTKRFNQLETQASNLANNFDKLSGAVSRSNEQVKQLDPNSVELMRDLMYADASPEGKLLALKSGSMDDRLQCKVNNKDCDKKLVRETLIERYEFEVDVMRSIRTGESLLQGIHGTQAIITNLGIDIGDDGRAMFRIAGGFVSGNLQFAKAALQFSYGNYVGAYSSTIGAIASWTGMFSVPVDPDHERFKVIIENQERIYDGLAKVSEQVQQSHKILETRLMRLEWEQQNISSNLKELMWAEWRSCLSVYIYSRNPDTSQRVPPLVDPETLRFVSFADARKVIESRGDQIRECLRIVRQSLDSVSLTEWFGLFLDTKRVLDIDIEANFVSSPDEQEDRKKWKSIRQQHLDGIVNPVRKIVADWAKRNKISESTLLELQMSRISNARELSSIVDDIKSGNKFDCESNKDGNLALRELICVKGVNDDPNEIAGILMEKAIHSEYLLAIVDWIEVLAQLSDLYRPDKSVFANTLSELATFPNISSGEELIRKTIGMIGLANAYHSRIYGGATALAIAEDILSGQATEMHFTVLKNNPYLSENTMLLLMGQKGGLWSEQTDNSYPTFDKIYAQALHHAKTDSEESTRFVPLFALFGSDNEFAIDDENRVGLNFTIDNTASFFPLPPPIRLIEGKFVYLPRYSDLKERQDRLFDNLYFYKMGKNKKLSEVILKFYTDI